MTIKHMKIEPESIKIKDLINKFVENDEVGVWGYHGKLNIRPAYQREFIYKGDQKRAVIETIIKGFPLNTIYWVANDDGTYELLDGQQRIMSIIRYVVTHEFKIDYNGKDCYFHTFEEDESDLYNKILNYELNVYLCYGGNYEEKMNWFKTINIAGEKLTPQELRNAIYSGAWVTDAKKKFSKSNGGGIIKGESYVNGRIERQEFLETAIKWVAGNANKDIEDYMARNRKSGKATNLFQHFEKVIDWVEKIFINNDEENNYDKEMKNVDWGEIYRKYYKDTDKLNPDEITKRVNALLDDDDIDVKKGIYEYVLTDDDKSVLNLRKFRPAEKKILYKRQDKKCLDCGKEFPIDKMEADHIKPWSEGGATRMKNAQLLCVNCNRRKGAK